MGKAQFHSAEREKARKDAQNALKVSVVQWISEEDGLADVISDELSGLGYCPEVVQHDATVSKGTDVVFTFGPYGNYLRTVLHLSNGSPRSTPLFVHWNTEGIPDLRLPWSLVRTLASARSWVGRQRESSNRLVSILTDKFAASWEDRILRFRYIGDYHYAYGHDLLHVFSDSSAIYARIHQEHGLPTVVAPWGSTKRWYADLGLERDIDVLWIGQRGSKRRGQLLDRVRHELQQEDVAMHVIDNVENPFVYGKERTRILNRAKITLNLTRTWFDDNYSRFAMAAPNRSLIVSEPLLPHCPEYEPGVHYVSAPIEDLAQTIIYYLKNDEERQQIVENAYQLSTTKLTLRNSMASVMEAVSVRHQVKSP